MNQSLLETKFHIPPRRAGGVSRARLVEQLQYGLDERRKLAFLSAPAGYGKTSLVTEWIYLLAGNVQVGWISLDESDNDPTRFLFYFISAFRRIHVSLGQSALSLLGMPQIPQLTGILDELINELARFENQLILILDDYHVIHHLAIQEMMEYFLERQPSQVHLVLTTREDPPLPIARWRARGKITEIRANDLRFTQAEVQQFFDRSMRIKLEADTIHVLNARIEGWAAGLQLAALALQNTIDQEEFISSFSGSHRYIIDYLLEEVLKRQAVEIRDFLSKTCVLHKFNSGLCEAVSGNPDSKALLSQLERSNLFLVSLDDQRGWYRYHQLFADVLRVGLAAESEREIQQTAAAWFETQGMLAEAIPYWLSVPDMIKAEKLIARLAVDLLNNGELLTLLRWLNALPDHVVNQNPNLLSYKALSLLLTGQIAQAQNFAELARRTSENGNATKGLGPLLSIQAWFAMVSGNSQSGVLAQKALEQLEETEDFFRAIAMLALGDYYSWNANLQAANQVFREGVTLGKRVNSAFMALSALANLAYGLFDQGKLIEAELLCRTALEEYVDNRGSPLPILGLIYSPLASICYEKGDFDQARDFALRGIDLSKRLFSNLILGGDCEVVLARIAFQQGELDSAFELLQSTLMVARQRRVEIVAIKMTIAQIDLLLLQGNEEGAKIVLTELESQVVLHQEKTEQIIAQLNARYWIGHDHPEEALNILDNLEQAARKAGCMRRLIGVHITQALAHQKLKNPKQAKTTFESALRLAAAEGYKTVFFPHDGWQTRSLLQTSRSIAPVFVDSILKMRPAAKEATLPLAGLAEPLSEQELRVLKLVVAGKSNQDIANELVIGIGTAKWHVHNILQKLGVNNRPQAIARVRELGIE